MDELKQCPFCGGEARLEHYYDTDGYLPMCSTEGCFGMIEKWFDTKEEAIKAWNRRKGDRMRLIDADALDRMGYVLTRTYQQDKETMVYETKKLSDVPSVQGVV